ncbi:uncharacterized protein LOC124116403 [Haliotis rufescens]|uniref:uncharacterized protein LOC124116403 n=1 Tax=Haliotis rufescens TaxID=6454 RepID=UPI00201E90ED|nr:uncharacterized protein LOC124116403 [Haliotis rufescens]
MKKRAPIAKKKKVAKQDISSSILMDESLMEKAKVNIDELQDDYLTNVSEHTYGAPRLESSSLPAARAPKQVLAPKLRQNTVGGLTTGFKTIKASDFATISEVAASIKVQSILDVTGIPTVTDATLSVLVNTMSAAASKNIVGVRLTGCHLVTNRGIALMSRSFENLQEMDMTGCQRVTEAVFGPLIHNCKHISRLTIAGTGIRVVPPRYIGYIKETVQGCPLVSPTEATLQAKLDGKSSKDIPQRRNDSMKVVIVRRNGITTNLLQSLRKESQSRQAITVDTAYKIGSTAYPIIECQEGFLDLYVTPRTVYVITTNVSDDKKLADEAASIAAVICQVASRVGGECGFIVAGLDSDKVKAVPGNILKNKVMTTIGTIVEELKASTKAYKPTKLGLDGDEEYQGSEVHGCGMYLMDSLNTDIQIATVTVKQTSTGLSDADRNVFNKNLLTSAEKLDGRCEEYQNLVDSPDIKELLSAKMATLLTGGLHDMPTAGTLLKGLAVLKGNPHLVAACLGLLNILGKVCVLELEGNVYAASVEWIASVINAAAALPPGGSTNNGKIVSIADKTPVWTNEEFQKMLKEKLKLNENKTAELTSPFKNLGVVFTPRGVINLGNLDLQPPVPMTHFHQKSHEAHSLMVSCLYSFPHQLSTALFHLVLAAVLKLHTPVMLWSHGVVLHDGVAEVTVKKDGNSILLRVDCVKGHNESASLQVLWFTFQQYHLVTTYILAKNNLSYQAAVTADKESPSKSSTVLYGHKFPSMEKTLGGKTLCEHCGLTSTAAQLSKTAQDSLQPSFLTENNLKLVKGKMEGSVVVLEQGGVAQMRSPLTLSENSSLTFTFLSSDNSNVKLKFVSPKDEEAAIFDLANGEGFAMDNGKRNNFKLKSAVKTTGVPVTFTLAADTEDKMMVKFKVGHGNVERIAVPIMPLRLWVDGMCSFTLNGYSFMQANLEVKTGMRLEALDLLNPSLVCVATVAEIAEDGQLLIHFDGWTSKYDYWTQPDVKNLHPLGYMAAVGRSNKQYSPKLQAPKNYGRQFDWAQYLQEEDTDPVPWDFFSDIQKEGTPPDETLRCLNMAPTQTTSSGPRHLRCQSMKNRGSVIEQDVRTTLRDPPPDLREDLSEFLTRNQRLFCVLPKSLNINFIRYPSLSAIANHMQQNIHFLCHPDKFDVHMVDHPGIAFPTLAGYAEMETVLILTYLALLLQEHTLPGKLTTMFPEADKIDQDQEKMEIAFTRLMRLYFKMLWFLSGRHILKQSKKLQRIKAFTGDRLILESNEAIAVNTLLTTARTMDSFNTVVSGQGNPEHVQCKPHELAMAPLSEVSHIDLDSFDNYHHLIFRLDLRNNQLKELPEDLFTRFFNLTHLNLARNQLMTLPLFAKCDQLTSIDVSYNKLAALPADLSQVKDKLVFLNISHNPLYTLPAVVQLCKNLVELHADNVGKVPSMEAICTIMPALEKLSLNYNVIEKLPSALPSQLKVLGLAGIPIIEPLASSKATYTYTSFETFVSENTFLSKMSEQERKSLFQSADPGKTGSLTRDGVVQINNKMMSNEAYLRFGQRTDTQQKDKKNGPLPNFLLSCKTLESLDVSNNCLTIIEDSISDLTKLESLNLTNNLSLASVSAEITVTPLKELHLKNCPALKTPPKEVVGRGFKAIFGYLRRLRMGSVDCKRTKLMFVGLGGAGKTSLVRVLTDGSDAYYTDYSEQITDGIDITRWDVPVEGSKEPISYSTWDFAGQTVYYNTHQFFLSNRAVYFLLWNIRLGYEHAGLDFWLSSIACHAPKAPILVVGTHCDKVEKPRMPTDDLQRRYPQITGFYTVSSYTGDGIEQLKADLIKVTLEQKYMGEKIPEAWLNLEKVLIKARNLDLMPWKDVQKSAEGCGIVDDVELTQSIQFLHDLGSVQFFNTPFLKSYVVVRPQWIVDVMACVVTVHEGPVQNGRLKHSEMSDIWSKYSEELHPWLLRLTEEFDLTCPLKDEDTNIVPCLLPTVEPQYSWPALKTGYRETKMMYTYDYLPAGLFNRAQVRLHQLTDGSVMWKKGSLLNKNQHTALLLQISATDVLVKVQGYKPENILFLVHEVFECLISESYSGVQYDYFVPCMDCQSEHIVDPCMFPASKVLRAAEMKAPFLQCDKSFHIMSIPELQAIMPPDRNSDFDDHLGRTVRELRDLEDTSISIFFCYSKKNIPSLDMEHKRVHPGSIIEGLRAGGNKVSFCDTPETTDMETLTLSMKAAQVVVVGMSDEFIETEQCRNLIVYCQETLKKPLLLALVGDKTGWQKSDLNILLGDHVYVKIYEASRFSSKIKELQEAVKVKAGHLKKRQDFPKCFISYCWCNSKEAVALGSQSKTGALGWGDPRRLKKFLEGKGIKCWLDIERMGQEGFFEDIADGLRKCKVMIACVSEQYAESKNCRMEFRFAISTLKIPVILVVVGTSYKWESTEVGMIAVGHECPKVNLQYENEAGLLDVLSMVQDLIPKDEEDQAQTSDTQRQTSFQEVLELAERKFLRQLMTYTDSIEGEGYPHLVVVDINAPPQLTDEEKQALEGNTIGDEEEYKRAMEENKDKEEEKQEEALNKIYKEREKKTQEVLKQAEAKLAASKYCFRLLCEHEQGWHPVPDTIPFPSLDVPDDDYLKSVAPYLARLQSILKHSSLEMMLLNTAEGERLRTKLDEWCARTDSVFQEEYKTLLQTVMDQDKDGAKCGLSRCHMANGKTLWLCCEHEQLAYSSTALRYKEQLEKKSEEDVGEEMKPGETTEVKKSRRDSNDDDDDDDEDDSDEDEEANQLKEMQEAKPDPIPVKKTLKRQTSQACNVM